MNNYKKLSEKNSNTTYYIYNIDFSSNNKLHQHLVNCIKTIQSKQSASDTDNSQIIESVVTNKTILEDYTFKF